MKKFKDPVSNISYLAYRLLSPVFDPVKFVTGVYGYIWFVQDYLRFKAQAPEVKIQFVDLYPNLHDKTKFTPFDAHYFHQQLWAFENVYKAKPTLHVDVASTYELSGYISKVVPTEFVDIRPIAVDLPGLTVRSGSILSLPYDSGSLESVSCLHVIEHIGLGRYGDPVDPNSYKKAFLELARVLKVGGNLYFSTPVGKPRICFNAHRVFDPAEIVNLFSDLQLVSFNAVNDVGKFLENITPEDVSQMNYALGMYKFTKK